MLKELRILLVDDSEADLFLMKHQLRSIEGLNIRTSHNVEEVKKRIDLDSFGCFIIDFNLPDGNGIDLFKYIRYNGSKSPIIIITGGVDDETRQHIKDLGIDAFIFKDNMSVLPNMVIQMINLLRLMDEKNKEVNRKIDEVRSRIDNIQRDCDEGRC